MKKAILTLALCAVAVTGTACATLHETLETGARVIGKVGEIAPGIIRSASGIIKAAESEGKSAVDAVKSAVTGDSGDDS